MRSACLKAVFIALALLAAPVVAQAADATPVRVIRAPAADVPVGFEAVPQDVIVIEEASPWQPAPVVRYGCKRIWRCDSVVCDWRRGCWGAYGYMEGPYYTAELAKRQWERHGWSVPSRQRAAISK